MPNTTKTSGKNKSDDTLPEALNTAIQAWPDVKAVLFVPSNHKEYQKAIRMLDTLLDAGGADETHSLATLTDVLGTLIESYETLHFKEPVNDPVENLKYLMAEHHLTQRDLPEMGSQGVVSEILTGKRQLNLRQVQALAKRFKVSPTVFMTEP
jgi:HTH-type transcriptional regulator/antitoxin HigA